MRLSFGDQAWALRGRARWHLTALGAVLASLAGCAQIVGIGDTQVTSDGAVDATASEGSAGGQEGAAETSLSEDSGAVDGHASALADATQDAFCNWSGKHLCGKIGGGPIARADIFTPVMSQWLFS